MQRIAFHIQKGGVGKTTLSGNIAHALAIKGRKTIMIDCDPQGNLSGWFLKESPKFELADVLNGRAELKDAIVEVHPGLSILPTFGIGGELKTYAENKLNDEPFIFEDLSGELAKMGFDVAIYDLSPGMSRLEKCVILAMDEVITPLTPEYFGLDGIEIFNEELKKINKNYRKTVKHSKIVVNNLNHSFKRHNEIYEVYQKMDYDLYTIGQDSKLAESQVYNQSIFEYAPTSRVVPEIERLAIAIGRP
ncbi:MAG: plasmid partition protein [Spirochaetes bacterium GWF1_51_8]|nr:MAG: plasmid partition protein [Spirochaetes bacterium GWF1_51_8]